MCLKTSRFIAHFCATTEPAAPAPMIKTLSKGKTFRDKSPGWDRIVVPRSRLLLTGPDAVRYFVRMGISTVSALEQATIACLSIGGMDTPTAGAPAMSPGRGMFERTIRFFPCAPGTASFVLRFDGLCLGADGV